MMAERPIEVPASLPPDKREAYREMVLAVRASVAEILSTGPGQHEAGRRPSASSPAARAVARG
jgi:hypothetical protein